VRIGRAVCWLLVGLWLNNAVLASDWIYTLRKGDTLWDICLQYTSKNGCWLELGRYNHILYDRAISVGASIRIPTSWLTAVPVVGEVTSAVGDVYYDQRSSGDRVPVAGGAPVHLGASIFTGQGFAQVRLGDHSEILIRPESELRLDSLTTGTGDGQRVELNLDSGEVESTVIPERNTQFQIKTPAAISAVRGTRYRLNSSGGNSMRTEVIVGEVGVNAATSAVVPAGFGILAESGQPLDSVRALLPAPALSTSRLESVSPVLLQWQALPQAASWKVDIYASGAGANLLASHVSREPKLVLSSLDEGCYRAAIRGVDEAGFNGLEANQVFCVVAPPVEVVVKEDPWWPPALAILALFLIAVL